MAFYLRLQNDTETADFLGEDFLLTDGGLQVETPESRDVWGGDSVYAHGAQLISSKFGTRTFKITFSVFGNTRDSLLGNIALLDRLIDAARRRSIEESGSRVELVYAWESTSRKSYFEVISGTLIWPDNVMSIEQVHQQTDQGWVIYDMELELIVNPFSTPISPVDGLPYPVVISNDGGNGESIFVQNDGERNWIDIPGEVLQSSFPLFTSISMQSDSGEAEKTSKVYIGVRKGDKNFVSFLDDKDAAYVITGATQTADADYSAGGTYTQLPFSGVDEQVLIRWELSDEQIEATQGAFRLFGRCKDNTYWSPDANYAIGVYYQDTLLHKTEWRAPIESDVTLFDFGTVFLPPWLGSMEGLAGLSIAILGMRKLMGSTTINLDYLSLLPQDGGYRVLNFRGGGMGQFEYLVDDSWSGVTYHVNLAGKKSGLPYGLMEPITLQPKTGQRLYFLMEGTAGSTEISRKLKVSLGVVPTYMVLACY